MRNWNANNRERKKEIARESYQRHRKVRIAESVKWAKENPEARRKSARQSSKKLREKRQQIIFEAKAKPCVDCGSEYPPDVMDLDHVRGTKIAALSHFVSGKAKAPEGMSYTEAIFAEIAKCDVRCSNCHRLRHYYEAKV